METKLLSKAIQVGQISLPAQSRLTAPQAKLQSNANPAQADQAVDVGSLKGADEDADSRSIYVKNLSWSTNDAGLLRHFDSTVSAAGGSVR